MDPNRDGKEEWSEEQWEKWLTHDIGLDEFEDEDLSEITKITDEFLFRSTSRESDGKDHVTPAANGGAERAEDGAAGQIQAETRADAGERRMMMACPLDRPKRPTTLDLFPQLPRTQDTLNNNSQAKKFSWQQKISQTSPPLKTAGEPTPSHTCLSDEEKHQPSRSRSRAKLRDCGTSTDKPNSWTFKRSLGVAPVVYQDAGHCRSHVPLEPTEEIHLTPVQRPTEELKVATPSNGPSFLSPDNEAPPPYQSPEPPPPPYFSCVDEVSMCPSHSGAGEAHAGQESPPRDRDASGLSYDAVKYTLVVDEHDQLELVSLRECYRSYSDDSDDCPTVYDNCVSSPYQSLLEKGGGNHAPSSRQSEDSTPEADIQYSRKFLNVFMRSCSQSSSTESFGLFSCLINGEEKEQTHRAVYRFVPRHEDELELELNDPLLVELQGEDFWFLGYNMRTGARGVFPAFYASEVLKEQDVSLTGGAEWMERFRLKFLGSAQVPHHKGSDVLCAAMQKVAMNRRLTVHYNPPPFCVLEISVKGLKMTVQDDLDGSCQYSHFFQLKNVSFCGYHPRNRKYFGFISKHPAEKRFACHVFVSENSTKPLAESVRKAFHHYYKEFVEVSCPTEDIYLE